MLLIGTTLIVAVAVPIYSQFVLGEEWLAGLPSFVRLLVTNTVVLAVITGMSLNLLLNILLGGENEPA